MDEAPVGLYRKILVNVGRHDERYDYTPVFTGDVPQYANAQTRELIAGLVRSAEILEVRDRDNGSREIWDDRCRTALRDARMHGWAFGALETAAPPPAAPPSPAPARPEPDASFREELESLINRHCLEGGSMTPDYVLADYLQGCLDLWNRTTRERDRWWDHKPSIGGGGDTEPAGNAEPR